MTVTPARARRCFYDTEFIEDGHTIDLVSIGLVAENPDCPAGAPLWEYYAVSAEFDQQALLNRPWLVDNVWPHLPLTTINGRQVLDLDHPDVKPRQQIRDEIQYLLFPNTALFPVTSGERLELWAYCGCYDHVVLAWLWGVMVETPAGLPYSTFDVAQLAASMPTAELPRQADGLHNALADARHAHHMYSSLKAYQQQLFKEFIRLVRSHDEAEEAAIGEFFTAMGRPAPETLPARFARNLLGVDLSLDYASIPAAEDPL